MIPMNKLNKDSMKANQNPILRFLPQHPTAYAKDNAIAKKNRLSIDMFMITQRPSET